MLYEDEDDIFVGSPRSKFFDVVFNASRGVVENTLEECIERQVALETLFQRHCEEKGLDMDNEIRRFCVEEGDALYDGKVDFFIATTGDIVTQNE